MGEGVGKGRGEGGRGGGREGGEGRERGEGGLVVSSRGAKTNLRVYGTSFDSG